MVNCHEDNWRLGSFQEAPAMGSHSHLLFDSFAKVMHFYILFLKEDRQTVNAIGSNNLNSPAQNPSSQDLINTTWSYENPENKNSYFWNRGGGGKGERDGERGGRRKIRIFIPLLQHLAPSHPLGLSSVSKYKPSLNIWQKQASPPLLLSFIYQRFLIIYPQHHHNLEFLSIYFQSQIPSQCLGHSKNSIHVDWVTEWVNQWIPNSTSFVSFMCPM